MPNRSTCTNLACFSEYVTKALDEKTEVHTIYTDYSKAFDSLPHHLLLLKMERQFGIANNLLQWFDSYLSNRFQRVVLNGMESDWVAVTSGVPQGSVLGPTLFLMYINDMKDAIKRSECLLFADDGKLFKIITSMIDCFSLQCDIDNLVEWCKKWRININISKCAYMNISLLKSRSIDFTYTIQSEVIEKVTYFKDLGVTFSCNFTFNKHINNVVSKSFQMFGFMRRVLEPISDPTVYLSLYHSLIRSRLEYCSFIWSPASRTLVSKIERVQKKFLKYAAFKCTKVNNNLSYDNLCANFNLQSLENRRKMLDTRNLNKLFTNDINCPYLLSTVQIRVPRSNIMTRYKPVFHVDSRLNVRKNSPIQRASSIANNSPLDVVGSSAFTFKSLAKDYFS